MKKFLLIGFVFAAAFTGCTVNDCNCPTHKDCNCTGKACTCTPGADCKYHAVTLDLKVAQPDWIFDNNSQQYYFTFDVPEITASVYDYGTWTVCREFNAGTKNAYQVALPMSTYQVETLEDDQHKPYDYYYTQHIDYRVGVGYVEVQLTNSDYFYPTEKPETMVFRLQLVY